MRLTKTITALFLLHPFVWLQAQDYSSMNERFVKKEPEVQDTVAFRELGEQKVRQLFDKSAFFSQNYSNASNQAYVKRQIPDLFYIPTGDTLDVDGILRAIEQSKLTKGKSIELRTTPKKGYLGMTETLNSDPKFTFHLVLLQVPKSFGKEQEMVWQVFLYNPEEQTGKPKKSGKLKSGY